ncbi:hypothetical protein ACFLWB_00200 [Chloroflexota bacterium]
MGLNYTALDKPEIDNKVAELADRIMGNVILHLKPESLILIGSFAKGEATILLEDGNLKFLSDFELVVVSSRYLVKSALGQVERLTTALSQESNLEVGISGINLSLCSMFPPLFKTLGPTITNYDLKYGSRTIHGKNYLEKVPDFKPSDIPLWEGIRLLFNRMSAALKHFLGNNKQTSESIFHIYKVVLACQDALLLSTGNYHPSYAIRNRMLQEVFSEHFSELNIELPRFLPLTISATDYKLKGRSNLPDLDSLWFDVAEICNGILKYIIKKDMDIEFSDYLEFQEKYLQKSELNSHTQASLSSPLYQNSVSFVKMLMSSRGSISRRALRKMWSPWSRMVYSVIPLAYFSLSADSNVKEAYLERASEVLSCFGKLKEQYDHEKPEPIAEELYRLIYYCC